MNTRDELLNGLSEASSIIKQLANIQQRLNQVRSQYKSIIPEKKMGTLAKVIIVLMALNCVFSLLQLNIWGIIVGAVATVGVYTVMKFVYNKQNAKIDSENAKINVANENVKVQEQAVLSDLQQVQSAYREKVSNWYPDNYCSVDAVEFFYNSVKNFRADNLKEAINLYETALHQKRVEDTQKQALQQQKLNNLLSAGSLIMQGAALGEMSRHNATAEYEMERANRTLDNIRNGF